MDCMSPVCLALCSDNSDKYSFHICYSFASNVHLFVCFVHSWQDMRILSQYQTSNFITAKLEHSSLFFEEYCLHLYLTVASQTINVVCLCLRISGREVVAFQFTFYFCVEPLTSLPPLHPRACVRWCWQLILTKMPARQQSEPQWLIMLATKLKFSAEMRSKFYGPWVSWAVAFSIHSRLDAVYNVWVTVIGWQFHLIHTDIWTWSLK